MSAARHPERLARIPFVRNRYAGAAMAALGLLIAGVVITAPLQAEEQLVFAIAGFLASLLLDRLKGHAVTLALAGVSCIVSLRYLFWRLTDTLDFTSWSQAFLGLGLLAAEIYAVIALVIAYIQTAWPLHRRPVPLPDDVSQWPHVDVFIPSYNESLDIVKPTIFAALALDWPADKLHVHVLDDGRRADFREFCAQVGCGYIIRPDNKGAKAGNINHALTKTTGEYVAIFDCDHVPTRAFLQLTLGWMLRDRGLCMVQTPHHFYSPDPFERNLASGESVPNESLLFYGLIQEGNDFWGATFFCGSCAVIRRTALEGIGGVPTSTVTEDCHASLRMQRAGWRTAYLRIPLAAGLATERLMLHIGQRLRWGRGMIQILRTECPLFIRSLSWSQRLCYFMAMYHFLFPLPRFVFLTAPLAWLLLGENVIAASPLAILAYAGPHILHSTTTGSRIQGHVRHSFWSEIYEAVLSVYLLPVTLATLLDPRKGKFNVTDKGGTLQEGYFDLRAVGPNMVLAFFLLVGVLWGVVGMATNPVGSLEFQAFALNLFWAMLCLLTVLAGLAVGRERRQVRERARIGAQVRATIRLADGRIVEAGTRDLSLGGAALDALRPDGLPDAGEVMLTLDVGAGSVTFPAEILRWTGDRAQLRFTPHDVQDEGNVVRAVFGRADAWVDWDDLRRDRPLRAFIEVMRSVTGLFRGGSQFSLRKAQRSAALPAARTPALAPDRTAPEAAPAPAAPVVPPLRASRAAAVLLALGLALPGTALAQARIGQQPLPAPQPAAPAPATAPAPVAPAPVAAPQEGAGARRVAYTLRQLGLRSPMQLRGTTDLQGVLFGVRGDEVVTQARLVLQGATSPALLPELSQIAVTLNEQFIGAIQPDRSRPSFGPIEFPVNPVFFADTNRLNMRFSGRYAVECNDPLSGLLWATVSDTSTLHLLLEKLPPVRDLARLPEPFFDARLTRDPLVLPVVVPEGAGNEVVRAAVVAASWFAVQADYRGAQFSVSGALPPRGHAVVIAAGPDAVPGLSLPRFDGPTIALVPHPSDPYAAVLVLGGRTGAEAAAAATVLAVGREALSGEAALVQAPELRPRAPYDAPRWVRTDRPVRLGDLVDPSELQAFGYAPGAISIPFRTAPDLYTWRSRPLPLTLAYRTPPAPIADAAVSRLDVSINDLYLRSLPLQGAEPSWPWSWFVQQIGRAERREGTAGIPPWSVFGQNDLQLRFDMRPIARGDCTGIPSDIRASIDPDSTLDLSRAHRFTTLPNLAFFAGSGFPFTRLADLSGTAAILPDRPSPQELSAFLTLIGRLSATVGHPATGLQVVRPQALQQVAGLDLIVVGALGRQPALGQLLHDAPVQLDGNRLTVATPDALADIRHIFGGGDRRGAAERAAAQLASPGEGLGALIGFESPLTAGRSVVALTGSTPAAVESMVLALRDPEQLPRVQGDLALLSGGRVQGYALGGRYTHGELPFWLWPQYLLGDDPVGLLVLLFLGPLLVAAPLFWVLRRRAVRRLRERTT
ncbi:UDP-forming cellulose synthase catalytic subunit [Paracraurococcus lichenis]|uniref:Cellulose synthase catalytic subunit [UDP-forming] n=1 Tax=Paracraurococcus lichenis TaxID=3064888 RepID=A0ABT9DWA2_9PROT|nr:UDP-forming cellulose synthase catalytic subunit [Paracraurococcus sp. LOR1-02]MDO9708075.1 UDP-forming cellulose synthase catalytic subunit [Paracraurococcus sp. LOR1-02]